MKKYLFITVIVFFLTGVVYLVLPAPAVPSMADAVRSDEPGDTWQHPDQKAFYTFRNNRVDILSELQKKFSLNNFGFLSFRLNYRPEEAQVLVRDQLKSYYLEEVIHPLRESLFINVLDPEKSPQIDEEARGQQRMFFYGKFYPIKVTLKPVYSALWARLLIWTLIFPSAYLVLISLKCSTRVEPL